MVTDIPATASVGDSLTFVWKDGATPYHVTVLKNGTSIHDDATFGTTTYTFDTTGHGAGTYQITVTDGTTTITSRNCVVTSVAPSPMAWVLHPSTAVQGDTLTYTFTGGTGPFTGKASIGGLDHDNLDIGNTRSYTWETNATDDQAGSYVITIVDNSGDTVDLTQNLALSAAPIAAHITTNPAPSTTVVTGQPFTLTVVATGAQSYAWQKLESDGITWTPVPVISPNITDTYTDSNATSDDAGSYRVVVKGDAGTPDAISTTAVVTVSATPPINVTYVSGDITFTLAGNSGAATATKTSTDKTGTTVALSPTTGLSNGDTITATISAQAGYTVNGGATATFTYPVSGLHVPVTSVTVSGANAVLKGQTTTLTAVVAPPGASSPTVVWSSASPLIATVNASTGVVTGVGNGVAAITATADGVASTAHNVTVTTAVTSVTVSGPTAVRTGSTITLAAAVLPSDASSPTVTWVSLDTGFATVNATTGVVTGVANGTARITATAGGITSSNYNVVVTTAVTSVDTITLTPPSPLVAGATSAATATVLPATASVKTVTWGATSTPSGATINATTGAITTLVASESPITVTITATSTDNTSASKTTTLIVNPATSPSPTITVHPASISVGLLAPATLTVTATRTGTGVIHYQWQKQNGASWDNVGTDSNTYTTPASVLNVGTYRVLVTNKETNKLVSSTITSNSAVVTTILKANLNPAPPDEIFLTYHATADKPNPSLVNPIDVTDTQEFTFDDGGIDAKTGDSVRPWLIAAIANNPGTFQFVGDKTKLPVMVKSTGKVSGGFTLAYTDDKGANIQKDVKVTIIPTPLSWTATNRSPQLGTASNWGVEGVPAGGTVEWKSSDESVVKLTVDPTDQTKAILTPVKVDAAKVSVLVSYPYDGETYRFYLSDDATVHNLP